MAADFYLGKWQVFTVDCHVFDGKQKIKLEPKAMDLLVALANADGQVVSRDEIFELVWKNQIIADHVLYNLIAYLRKTLEQDPHKPQIIVTIPKKGYRLGQKVERPADKPLKAKNSKWSNFINICAGLIIFTIMVYWINKPTEENSTLPEKVDLPPSIAVLPFDVYDVDPNLSYFADGLAEEIIHQLSVIAELAVVSRTSSFSFNDQGLDIKTIAEKLNSQFILEGSIRKSGDQLRVTIQLIKAQTGTHLWSKVFDVTEDDVFKLQQDISLSVVNSLLPDYGQIPSGKLRVHPQLGDAYMHYLRGNAMAAKATVEYMKMAIIEFETAIQLQPNYALAHVALALNTMVLYQHRQFSSEEARRIAQNSIDRALEVEPFLALAHTAQGLLYINYGEFAKAEEAFKTALDLDPVLPLAHHNYGYLLWLQDNHQQALDHFQIALARSPMSAITNFAVADTLFTTGQIDDALKQYQHCIVLLPDYPNCHLGIAYLYRFMLEEHKTQQHMQQASQRLSEDNIYLVTTKTIDAFWLGDFIEAEKSQTAIVPISGGGYLELQLKTLINIHSGNSQDWLIELESRAEKWPDNKSLTVALALNYYFSDRCEVATQLYESVLTDNFDLHGKFNVAAWGISHIANLADCYQRAGNQLEYQAMMLLLTQQIKKFNTANYTFPGLILLKAKIDLLAGKSAQAAAKLTKLHELDWSLEWMKNLDPVLSSSK